jgi:type I restriction enzyme R subunit
LASRWMPFDLICHVAFDQPPLSRKERAENVKKRNYFAKYQGAARQVLEALLDKYADTGLRTSKTSKYCNSTRSAKLARPWSSSKRLAAKPATPRPSLSLRKACTPDGGPISRARRSTAVSH